MMYFYRVYHIKSIYFFQIRSRIWTCGKVLFELDMPHVKQNPSVSQFRCFLTKTVADVLALCKHITFGFIYKYGTTSHQIRTLIVL